MTHTEIYLTHFLGKVLRNENIEAEILPDDVDIEELLLCAKKNSVLHMIYNSVSKLYNKCFDDSSFVFQEMCSVQREVIQSHAWTEFEDCAEKNGVNILMLKGIYLKNFYPEPALREMCDIDILYDPQQTGELEQIFVSLGYKKGKVTTCHTGWFNPENGVTFEAHHILNSHENKKLNYYKNFRKRANLLSGKKHIFCMSNEDMYIHLLLHIRSHLRTNSVMLKQLTDLYIMKNKTELNPQIIEGYLKELGLERFAYCMDSLISLLFENDAYSVNESEFSMLADYIFGNLSFGDFSYSQARESVTNNGSKFKLLLRQIFPTAEKIYNSYPFISRHRYLLPIGYVYRIFQSFGIRKANRKKKLEIISDVSPEAALQGEKINEFFAEYGIN